MAKILEIAIVATMTNEHDSAPANSSLAELARRLKEEMRAGRNIDMRFLPGVTVSMLAFYRKYPNRN